jgi:hypothetical protein
MGSNILEQSMIDDTLAIFRDGNQSDVSASQGVMLIDGWLQALDKDPHLDHLKQDLTALRNHLNTGNPDANTIRELMGRLAICRRAVDRPTAKHGPNHTQFWE